MSMESPPYDDQIYENDHVSLFHWDMSFRRSAHIYNTYSYNLKNWFRPIAIKFKSKRKTASVLFVNSNCGTNSKRETFIQKLMDQGLKIDALGGCLRNFPDNSTEVKIISSFNLTLLWEFASQYKFVIAMENSICDDYVTEKFGMLTYDIFSFNSGRLGNVINAGVVPIIYLDIEHRCPDYSKFVPFDNNNPPEASYINLAQFSSAKEAANYISDVAENETIYNKFLWYRNQNLTDADIDKIIVNMLETN